MTILLNGKETKTFTEILMGKIANMNQVKKTRRALQASIKHALKDGCFSVENPALIPLLAVMK